MAQWIGSVNFGNGKEGAPAAYNQGHGICTGSAGSTTLSITDVNSVWRIVAGEPFLIHQSQGTGAGQWEINVATDTLGTGNHTLAYPLSYTYSAGAQLVRIPQFTGGTLSATLTPTSSWNGSWGGIVAIMSNGNLTISGSINVNGVAGTAFNSSGGVSGGATGGGFRGGNGYNNNGGSYCGYRGEGYSGGLDRVNTALGNAAGGGGQDGSGGDSGGGGGNGTAGGRTATKGGFGGGVAGNAELTSMVFGGGGSGSGYPYSYKVSGGGSGGGIIIVFAKNLTVSGSLVVNGGAGGSWTGGDPYGAMGGGGAGGSILIKCQTANLGTNIISAGGGAGGTISSGTAGGAGGAGRIRVEYLTSITGSINNPSASTYQNSELKSGVYYGMV